MFALMLTPLVQTVKVKYAWKYDHDDETGFPEYSGIT